MNYRKIYIETYGCQMNVSDSEIVASVLKGAGHRVVGEIEDADVVLLNTCSVRDNAERKIKDRVKHLRYYAKRNSRFMVGIIGCMAERLQEKLLDER